MKRTADIWLVAGVALLAYVGNVGNGFVYDDRFVIERNPAVQDIDWRALVVGSYWGQLVDAGLYRPLTLLSFGLNRALGASATGFHLVNDVLHGVASMLVLLTARALGTGRFVALAAGLIFALHPLQTEAVNTIVGRGEILAFVFALGAFLLYVQKKHPVGVGLLFFLALCSKESAAFALPLFALYWLLFERRHLLPVAGAVVIYAVVRVSVLSGLGIGGREIGFVDNPLASAPMAGRVLTAPVLLAKYTGLVLWPRTLSADYSYNQIPIPGSLDFRVIVGLAVAMALRAPAARQRGAIAFAAMAFLLPLSGFLHIAFPLGTLFAERLSYLPMLGAALLIALALGALPRRSVLLAALLVAFAVRVVARNRDWRDNETLFRQTVATSPESARSHFLLGTELFEQARFAESAASFETGLGIAPQHVGARMSLGEAQLEAGNPIEAQAAFEDALARAPSDEIRERALTAALAAGRERARTGMWDDARHRFRRALELDPRNVDATNSLGLVFERQGDVDTARSHYETALVIDADYTPAVLNLASVRMQMGELEAAVELFSRAVALAPSSYEAYNGLGIAMARQGQNDEAEAAFRKALAIDPALDAARDNLRALGKTP